MNLSSKDIADFLNKDLFGQNINIKVVKPIDDFINDSISFATKDLNKKVIKTRGFLILNSDLDIPSTRSFSYILSENPRLDFSRVLKKFFSKEKPRDLRASSYIDPLSNLGLNTSIGHSCFVGKNVWIGDGTIIGNNVSIMDDVKIGKDCFIKSGSIIGEKGFGIEFDDEMIPISIPHIAGVEIGDNVEIGSLNTICRGTISPTKIGSFTKTDDHVHIAHNCDIGQYCILTASCCFGGSVKTGHYCWFGLNSTIKNGIKVSNYNMVGTHANVVKNTKDFEVLAGSPARRIGWVSRALEKLDLPSDGEGTARCKKTGTKYILKNSAIEEVE